MIYEEKEQVIKMDKKDEIRLCEKSLLTLSEAAAYTNIGEKKLREISNSNRCTFVLFVGNKRLFKRKLLDAYLEKTYSI